MELILVLALGVPLGRYLPSRNTAWAALAAAFLIVLPFQTASVRDAGNLDWTYWVVQVVIAALGAGLVALGARWRVNRRKRRAMQAEAGHEQDAVHRRLSD